MSNNYDNWERLVGAVLRTEQFRQLARQPSTSSMSSMSVSELGSPVLDDHDSQHKYADSDVKQGEMGVLGDKGKREGKMVANGYYLSKQRMAHSNSNLTTGAAVKNLPGSLQEFKFRDLKRATDNFDEKNKLGQGGYGVVYKGFLPKENFNIAASIFSRGSIKGTDNFGFLGCSWGK